MIVATTGTPMTALPRPSSTDPAGAVAAILARGTITADDVLALRRQVFADGIVSRAEAETMFVLNEGTRGNAPAWDSFFIEALTDYFVWQSDPRGYVDEAGAAFLMEAVGRDGRIDAPRELELIVNIVHWAASCPETLRLMALQAVKTAVLSGGGVLFGPGRRRPGVIDRADVSLVSKLIYAAGGEASLRISRREADLLFDLNDATSTAENDAGWRDLFVRAVASHLMFPQGEPHLPDADTMRRRDQWLAERRSVGTILGLMLNASAGAGSPAFSARPMSSGAAAPNGRRPGRRRTRTKPPGGRRSTGPRPNGCCPASTATAASMPTRRRCCCSSETMPPPSILPSPRFSPSPPPNRGGV
ncbi:MAG: hypothetical protein U1E66_03390 [Rhodospirillales bacterium]